MSELPIVPVDITDRDRLIEWVLTANTVYLNPMPTPEEAARRQQWMADHRLFAAYDQGRTVATFRSFDCDLTVPGRPDPLPVNAVSTVSVLPTHRRRGLLARWISMELARAATAGSPASILIASEAPIYGRYGYGAATTACTWTVDASRASFLQQRAGSVEMVDPQTFVEAAPAVYERARRTSPGTIRRSATFWGLTAHLTPPDGGPDRHRRLAVHRDSTGVIDGLLAYKIDGKETDRVSHSTLQVLDLVTASDAAYADLWRYCCEVDFVTTVVADDRSPREPLPLLLADPRAARDGPTSDFVWVRLHDVAAALSSRRYPIAGRLRLTVLDEHGQTSGDYLVEVDANGSAECTRVPSSTTGTDVTLDAAALASLWLGSGDAAALSRTGHLHARDERAMAWTDALLGWPEPAWCGTWF